LDGLRDLNGLKTLIVIPAYNEEENIGGVLDCILSHTAGRGFDLLVVDDGSADGTRAVCAGRGVSVVTAIFNMGYGAALKTAYKYAEDNGYDYIIQMDADGQHDVRNIDNIYEKLLDADTVCDIVIGSRFLAGSVAYYIPPHKRVVISIFNFFIKLITHKKITDPTSGLQGLNRHAFSFYAGFNMFAIDYPDANMIIQMALREFVITEIPAIMHVRERGVSMHGGVVRQIKYIIKMTLAMFVVYMREKTQYNKVCRHKKVNKDKTT
jgi:glycosyltransferase involved in cell wall biosynthesis